MLEYDTARIKRMLAFLFGAIAFLFGLLTFLALTIATVAAPLSRHDSLGLPAAALLSLLGGIAALNYSIHPSKRSGIPALLSITPVLYLIVLPLASSRELKAHQRNAHEAVWGDADVRADADLYRAEYIKESLAAIKQHASADVRLRALQVLKRMKYTGGEKLLKAQIEFAETDELKLAAWEVLAGPVGYPCRCTTEASRGDETRCKRIEDPERVDEINQTCKASGR